MPGNEAFVVQRIFHGVRVFRAFFLGVAGAAFAWSCSQHPDLGENVRSFQEALSSTGGQAGAQVEQLDLQFRLPHSVPLEQVMLSGEASIKVGPRTQITEPSRAVFTVSLGSVSTDGEVRLGSVAARGAVTIGNQATVTGDIVSPVAPHIGDEAQVLGTVRKDPLASVRLLSLKVGFPLVSGSGVVVNSGESRVLASASYLSIRVRAGGKVTLGAGTYYIGTLTVEEGGEIAVPTGSAAVVVYVKDSLHFDGTLAGIADPAPVLVLHLSPHS